MKTKPFLLFAPLLPLSYYLLFVSAHLRKCRRFTQMLRQYTSKRNGLFTLGWAMQKTSLLPPSVPLRRTYMNLPVVDRFLTTLVAFFWPAIMEGVPVRFRVFNAYFMVNLIALLALITVEGCRKSNWRVLRFPALWQLAFQGLSVALITPIYCMVYLQQGGEWTTLNARQAYALYPAILVGYGLPTLLLSYKIDLFSSNHAYQGVIAAWQIFPVYISMSYFLAYYLQPARNMSKSGRTATVYFFQACGLLCALIHAGTVFSIIASETPLPTFKQMFFLNFNLDRNDLIGLVHNFFLSDFLMCFAALTILALYMKPNDMPLYTSVIALALLGPGYLLMLVWENRERSIKSASAGTKIKKRQ